MRIGLALLAGALALGCRPPGPAHSAERLQCLRECAAQKDTCILSAHVAQQIQQCDGQNGSCIATCPL